MNQPHPPHTNEPRTAAARRLSAPRLLAAGILALAPAAGFALPSFARQMNLPCAACHTEFPILNEFGRQFKLSGFTQSAEQTDLPPLAVMLQPSLTVTQKGQEGGAAPGFGDNHNIALTQASVFYAGRLFGPYAKSLFGSQAADILDRIGVFSQVTYDGVAKSWTWDNTEVRFANSGSIGDNDLTYGFYANNNPTMQDPWNSTPAWGYPFVGSGLAPSPAAGTFIDGGFAQQVAGVGGYVWFADSLYADLGFYRTLGYHAQKSLGVDPSGEAQIAHPAPYWRLAWQERVGEGRWELGTFGMSADTYPGRDSSAGADRFVDLGVDSQYQVSLGKNDLTALAGLVYERESWDASVALGNTANSSDSLHTLKLTLNDVYDKTYGGSVQYFLIDGGSDAVLYAANPSGSPTSDGFVLQFDYMPFNKSGGPAFWPRSNLQLSLQYVVYDRFDGARTNYDGAGGNARDNNTLYAVAWIAF